MIQKHLLLTRIIASMSLFIYLIGGYDYLTVQLARLTYQNHAVTTATARYFVNYPWFDWGLWTINILIGLIASVLLFFSAPKAKNLFLIAGVADAVLLIVTLATRHRWTIFGAVNTTIDIVICCFTLALYGYCAWQERHEKLAY